MDATPVSPHIHRMDTELLQKLRARRSVVDSGGTSWVGTAGDSCSANPKPLESSASAFLLARNGSTSSLCAPRSGLGTPLCTPRSLVPTPAAVGKNKNELAERLHRQRTKWEKLPESQALQEKFPAALQREDELVLVRELRALSGAEAAFDPCPENIEHLEPRVWERWEPQPWEVLRRRARTWVCEAWLDVRLHCPEARDSGAESPAAAAQNRSHPAVLCLTAEGELMCCVAAPAPPGVGEEADYARLLGSVQVDLLLKISTSLAAPHILGFHVADGLVASRAPSDHGEPDTPTETPQDSAEDASDGSPAVLACFESAAEAESCAAAVSRAAAAPVPVSEGLPPELEAFVPGLAEAQTDLEESSLARDLAEISASFCGIDTAAGDFQVKAPTVCKLGPLDYDADAQSFLLELDQLAGFA